MSTSTILLWTDSDDKKREAVTLRARQALFEGDRSASATGEGTNGTVRRYGQLSQRRRLRLWARPRRVATALPAPTTCRSDPRARMRCRANIAERSVADVADAALAAMTP